MKMDTEYTKIQTEIIKVLEILKHHDETIGKEALCNAVHANMPEVDQGEIWSAALDLVKDGKAILVGYWHIELIGTIKLSEETR